MGLLPVDDAGKVHDVSGCVAVLSALECSMLLARRGEAASISGLFLQDLRVPVSLRKLCNGRVSCGRNSPDKMTWGELGGGSAALVRFCTMRSQRLGVL